MQHTKTNLTICIPRIDNMISKQEIFEKIRSLHIPSKTDDTKRVIVKFKTWVENELSNRILCRFAEDKDIKIVYNDPWYWVAYQIKNYR